MATRMQQRRGTAAQWVSSNDGDGPILNAGEIGWESDTNKFKIGDGVNNWIDLTYFVDATDVIQSSLGAYLQDSDVGAVSGVAGLDSSKNLLVPGSSIIVEGATDNAFETTLTITNPTSDREITFPDSDGTVVLTTTLDEMAQEAVNTALVAGTGLDKTYDDGSNTITLDIDSTVATLTGTQTLSNKTLTTPTINGPTITDTGQTPTIHGIYLPAPHTIIFEGTTANDFETTLTAGEPTGDRTITLPNATGTVALTSDITTAINNLVDGAPVALDTLNELAAAINDDASYASTITTALGLKAPLADPTFTGTATIPTLSLTNALSISNGGTGQTTAMAAATALLPSQTSNSGKYLTNDGSGTLSWGTVTGYSAPTLGSTSIASGETVSTIAGLTLTAPTLTGTVTASGDINLSAANGPGSLIDELNLLMMGAL
jgi:hypothetical protein